MPDNRAYSSTNTPFGPVYPKINGIWKRDEKGVVLVGDWSVPEFSYLSQLDWVWTEKVDGTNIRLHSAGPGATIMIGGRTDKAQIPPKLVTNINLGGCMDDARWEKLRDKAGDAPITVYGEGYGAGIQKGGGNYRPDPCFIVFDVRVGDFWLGRSDVEDVAYNLGLEIVPLVGRFPPKVAWYKVSCDGEAVSAWDGVQIEGYVGRPVVDLFDR